ncbi:MAG: ribonuclease R [Deltaproteobacteria bacterium]|nr:ribonuclease R [Deltaproteobacteria bacterium]
MKKKKKRSAGKHHGSRKSKYIAKSKGPSCVGELSLHRDGYGFVMTANPDQEDVFVPARYIGDALHRDLVKTTLMEGRKGLPEGRIIEVVERRVTTLMGRLERQGKAWQVVADDRRVRHRIIVKDKFIGDAKHGDNVVVEIESYPSGDQPMTGRVVDVLGPRGDVATEKSAVIARHQLVREFTDEVEADARRSCERAEAAFEEDDPRKDLREISFITIDGETAKDFDDAVAVQQVDDGVIRLWVSIADVSFYISPGSPLDDEAYSRGTSVYFPGDCLPMLPEALSNDRCSLRPDEDRLTVTAEMDVSPDGKIIRSDMYRSVIRSKKRMTYTAVKQILVEKDENVIEQNKDIISQLETMERCFSYFRKERIRRGSIDFDLPEPEILIDMQGDISEIVRSERHIGHMMIEEFMIAANEAVARFLTEREVGCIYRVHEPPPEEKLRELSLLLHNLGYKFNIEKGASTGKLGKIVDLVRGKPEERLVNHMLLRSMSQAMYGNENLGHYGLASKCYCHFTSPIRRYPDLVVHRLLTRSLEAKSKLKQTALKLQQIAEHCSRRERVAMQAEREMAKLHAALFMQDRIGEEYDGVISHVTKFGFFVELIEFFVEGLVHISSLDDDSYFYHEEEMQLIGKKGKKRYKIGDKVRIEVEEIDIPNREILFLLV